MNERNADHRQFFEKLDPTLPIIENVIDNAVKAKNTSTKNCKIWFI
ncbi:MAG: hypothetical protein IJU48_05165 [Synergistaceae bacterium]|nr:hypothetical protein [Synergistaceae bacterium]